MKHETLLQYTPIGTDAEFQLVGGVTSRGRVVKITSELVVLDAGENHRTVFVESIVGFTVLAAAPAGVAHPPDSKTEDQLESEHSTTGALDSATGALEYRDLINSELSKSDGIENAAALAEQFAKDVIAKPEPVRSDRNLRYAIIQAFKLIEYHRKVIAADSGRHREAVRLSRGLVALNAAMRSAERVTDEDRFSDLYHLLAAVRPHFDEFREDSTFFEVFRKTLDEAWKMGNELLENPGVAAAWERQPFRRKSHYHRLSEIARCRVTLSFVTGAEANALEQKADRYMMLAERNVRLTRASVPAMGRIASFGTGRFGFIQTRDLETLFFKLGDVVSANVRDALAENVNELEVDFDRVPAEYGKKYERAVRVRAPGSSVGFIGRLYTMRNFGYIDLYDGRSVHFWIQALPDPDSPPVEGTEVICWATKSPKGWTTDRVEFCSGPLDTPVVKPSVGFLKTAQEARNAGDPAAAIRILEEGLRESPDAQMVMTLAAVTKEVDPSKVWTIYQRGVEEFPDNYLLHEHAGMWLAKLGRHEEALSTLEKALELTRGDPERRGLKGVLLALGRTLFDTRKPDAIRRADECYREVAELWGGADLMRARLPLRDLDCFDGVQAEMLRNKESEGNSFTFLDTAGLRMDKMRSDASGGFSDILCELDASIAADYGLRPRIFVRYSGAELDSQIDTKAIEEAAMRAAEEWETDPTVVVLVMPEVTDKLDEKLRQRLRPTKGADRPLVVLPVSKLRLEHHREPQQLLREILSSYLSKRDLFLRKNFVRGNEFFGRTAVIADITNRLLRNEFIGLFGLRRTGKTSVLQRIRETQEKDENIVLFQDLLDSKGKTHLLDRTYFQLAEQLRDQCNRRVNPGSGSSILPEDFCWDLGGKYHSHIAAREAVPIDEAFFSDLKRVLQALDRLPIHGRSRIILILDEIELLREKIGTPPHIQYSDTAISFFGSLKGLHQNHPDTFSAIITAANPSVAEQGRFDGVDNPVHEYIETLYLGFFEESECREMIVALGRGMGLTFEDHALRRVYEATAGHPFLARHLCSFVAQRRPDSGSITESAVKTAEAEFLRYGGEGTQTINEILERIRDDYPTEMTLLREIAEKGFIDDRGASNDSGVALRPAIRHLVDYGLVQLLNGRISIRPDLVRRALTPASSASARAQSQRPPYIPRSNSRPNYPARRQPPRPG